mmetsp:Transcript_9112/g.24739  ORF Transcript_9112/g.24739 Transcript_9112/m.24739 type:complete len:148 (-) Transcript_9112:248-691(-)|eukprot:CAMPEP_0113885838 /NCGR_PEP_ID=MMETSP0780_2-20120614/11166_1 /TAXON_ID=652834 /ORGANISM="Palpitomonas bilix" /LENGTH=147 /DNA_ID=CAMNT_0000873875 /DNA_START=99 /DNA_END=542 /DNA_ORIENTATION=- /assembly_acc=CAM_ASM_000599
MDPEVSGVEETPEVEEEVAAVPAAEPVAEPEEFESTKDAIEEWKAQHDAELKAKREKESELKKAKLDEAKKALEEFQKEVEERRQSAMEKHRAHEEQEKEERAALDASSEAWPKVCKLVNLNGKTEKDTSRMKSLLISLKNDTTASA